MPKQDRISQILEDIQAKKEELYKEYEKLKSKYDFSEIRGKINFSESAKKYQQKFKIPLLKYLTNPRFKHLISVPFIYGMIIPAIFLDVCLFVYQQTAMRLYGIPLVTRKNYIQFDRKHLSYLNLIQKINCLYCSYVNGLFQYAVEVAGRTEKYWCPIKAAKRKAGNHDWEEYFADYWDPEGFKEAFNSNKEFHQKKKKT